MSSWWERSAYRTAIISSLALAFTGHVGISEPARAANAHPSIDPRAAEVKWRWIGIPADPEQCIPDNLPASWTARWLFSAEARMRFTPLGEFCVFEYDGPGTVPPEDLALIQDLANPCNGSVGSGLPEPPARLLTCIASDRMAVTGAGSVANDLLPGLEALFYEQTGRAMISPSTGGGSVRWTLVDTSPTGAAAGQGKSRHGSTLSLFAERLLCPDGVCVADIRTRLALAFDRVEPWSPNESPRDPEEGGYVGLIGELAEAIVEDVDEFKPGAASLDRLILNLSVAWDRAYGGLSQQPDAMPPDVLAVYRALESVACDNQVIAVAAAGNLADHHAANSVAGPLLPAAWRQRDAGCTPVTTGPPLVVAAGAVDGLRQPLGNSIPGGMPEFVAYGDHAAVTASQGSNSPSAILTGSSVATVALSTTLAAAAAYRSDLDLETLVDEIHLAGVDLGVTADFCADTPCPARRWISMCPVIHVLCTPGTSHCPSPLPACPPGAAPALPELPQPVLLPAPTVLDAAALVAAQQSCSPCGPVDVFRETGMAPPIHACPARQYHGLGRRPYNHPQPQSAMCPTCPFFTDQGKLYIEIDTAGSLASTESLTAPTLELQCGLGSPQIYQLSGPGLPPQLVDGDQILVDQLPTGCGSGQLSFVIEDGGAPVASVSQPLLVTLTAP